MKLPVISTIALLAMTAESLHIRSEQEHEFWRKLFGVGGDTEEEGTGLVDHIKDGNWAGALGSLGGLFGDSSTDSSSGSNAQGEDGAEGGSSSS